MLFICCRNLSRFLYKLTGGNEDDHDEEEEEDDGEDEEEEEEDDDDDEDGEDEEEENQRRYDFRQRKTVVRYQAAQDGTAFIQLDYIVLMAAHCDVCERLETLKN